ncbi:transcriptional regulator [Deltaproteobacteria bacterium]|nr:transcriptional regulator [Deltaproteobacteria bacterium]
MAFTETELAIMRLAQGDLPDSLTPYADIARAVNLEEKAVIAFLRDWKEQGVIRRFGASIKHQKAGFTHNAMVAWKIDEEHIDEAGKNAAQNRSVSHCYHRLSPSPDWPYTLYTMIHGKSEEDLQAVVRELCSLPRMGEYAMLRSCGEWKKASMAYF